MWQCVAVYVPICNMSQSNVQHNVQLPEHANTSKIASEREYMVAKTHRMPHGVAEIRRMLKNIGIFCKRDLQKRPIFCKTTYIFKHPTNRCHPIRPVGCVMSCETVRKVAATNGKALLKDMTCKDTAHVKYTHTHTHTQLHTHTHILWTVAIL